MSVLQIKSMVAFTRGSSLLWNALATPIPAGVVAFSIDDGAFKLGDGVTTFANLPSLFTYADLVSAQGGVSGYFAQPDIVDNGKIVVIALDASTSTMKYAVSNVSLASLLTSIDALEFVRKMDVKFLLHFGGIKLCKDLYICPLVPSVPHLISGFCSSPCIFGLGLDAPFSRSCF